MMTKCIICDKEGGKMWYTAAIMFGAKDHIDVGPWCDENCKKSERTAIGRARYALRKMALIHSSLSSEKT